MCVCLMRVRQSRKSVSRAISFMVPVRDVAGALDESSDDTPESQQAFVDRARFLRDGTGRSRPGHVLRPGQVDEVQFASLDDLLAVGCRLAHVHRDAEDAVRAARLLVELGLGSLAFCRAAIEQRIYVDRVFDDELLQTL